jgi:UDP-N-acetylglucosamine:LPS N-acetylglucosamine transferase
MKILFFNYEYPPLGGGAANATFHILRELSKIENLEIDLVTSSHDDKYYLEKIAKNIYIHKLAIGKKDKNLHFQSVKDLFLYTWKAYFYSKKLIKKINTISPILFFLFLVELSLFYLRKNMICLI